MGAANINHYARLLAAAVLIAAVLSLAFSVPYVWTALAFSGWLFFGRLITLDDDYPGGWSNPDGVHAPPLGELCVKAIVFALCALAACSPQISQWGR
jgi:hypothetical protein